MQDLNVSDLSFEDIRKKIEIHIKQKEEEIMSLPCCAWQYKEENME